MPIIAIKNSVDPSIPQSIEVSESEPDHRGGEAEVCKSLDGRWAVKLFYKTSASRERWVHSVKDLFRDLPPEQKQFIIPPLALVATVDGEPRVGSVMRYIPSPPHRDLIRYCFDPECAGRYMQQEVSWRAWLVLARNVANALTVLHGKGCAHGDIHYRNFKADLHSGSTCMLEIDGVIVQGFRKPDVKGMRGFMAPEVLSKNHLPDELTDRHSLAVLVLHTLLFRNVLTPRQDYDSDPDVSEAIGWGREACFSENPADRRNHFEEIGKPMFQGGWLSYRMLTPRLQRLTELALVGGLHDPERRPLARAWLHALACALDELVQCETCGQEHPYPHTAATPEGVPCPFCGKAPQGLAPVVLKLFDEAERGDFRPAEWTVVRRKGEPLRENMVTRQGDYPTSRGETVAGLVDWEPATGSYVLVNQSSSVWRAWPRDGGVRLKANRGASLPLRPGTCVQFGSSGRLALVTRAPQPRPVIASRPAAVSVPRAPDVTFAEDPQAERRWGTTE